MFSIQDRRLCIEHFLAAVESSSLSPREKMGMRLMTLRPLPRLNIIDAVRQKLFEDGRMSTEGSGDNMSIKVNWEGASNFFKEIFPELLELLRLFL